MQLYSDEDDATMTADPSPSLGYERTRIASERTLMAWVRTAVSLISFGFSIPKFLAYLAEIRPHDRTPAMSPRLIGALLIALGILGLVGGIAQHLQLIGRVAPAGRERDKLSVASFTAGLMAVVGLTALLSVVLP